MNRIFTRPTTCALGHVSAVPLQKRWKWFGHLLCLLGIVLSLVGFCSDLSAQSDTLPRSEAELLAILQGDQPAGDKALACKYLAVYGSPKAVPELAKLLANEQLSSWARIPLEAIPGAEADESLRNALPSLAGDLKIGVIHSLGVRRDANAVETLVPLVQDADSGVAAAAALALGRIGNEPARTALRQALSTVAVPLRGAVAEGCVLCAEQAMKQDLWEEAVSIYDKVRQAEVPRPRLVEATRGAILARREQGVPLLKEILRAPETDLFRLGLTIIREFPGSSNGDSKVDKQLAADLANISPERAALIVRALAERRGPMDVAAFLGIAQQGPVSVRVSAIQALGRAGDATCLTPLLEMATDAENAVAESAREALKILPGEGVQAELLRRMKGSKGDLFVTLIQVLGQRRIEATSDLVAALGDSDKRVRLAALEALGNTVPLGSLGELVNRAVSPRDAEEGKVAQLALKTAAVRMADRDGCAKLLESAMKNSPSQARSTLLDIVAAVGGKESLRIVGHAAKTGDPTLQDISSRLLGEWMTADAAPVLLDLAGSNNRYQGRAVRGYLRIARQFVMPDEERMEMCRVAMNVTRQPAEKKMLLDVLKRYPHPAGFKLASEIAKVKELKDDGTQTALAIAQKLGLPPQDLAQILEGLAPSQIEIVKAVYGTEKKPQEVTDLLRKQVGKVPLILLPSENYNQVFGDPAPGEVKKLQIEYRLNGKAGKVSLDENAPILLPAPSP